MKNLRRIAALWVVGCIAAAGSVFALDLGNGFSLGGEVVAGVKVVSQDDGDDDTTDTSIAALYDDWGDTLPRLRLNAEWSNDVFGVKGRVQVTNGTPDGAFGFGWVNFGKFVTLYTGNIDDSHFGTGDVVFNKDVDTGTGLKLLIKPIEALTIGAYVPFATDGAYVPFATETDIDDAFGNITIGLGFKHQLVNVTAAFKLGSQKDQPSASGLKDYSAIGVLYHVNSSPIPALTIDLSGYFLGGDFAVTDYFLDDFDAFSVSGYTLEPTGFAIAPRITYTTGAISAWGQVKVLAPTVPDALSDAKDAKLVEDPDAHIDLQFQVGYKVNDIFAPYLRFGLGVGEKQMETTGAFVRVGTPINLSDGLSFEVYDRIDGLGADDVGDVSAITNTLRAQIKYTF